MDREELEKQVLEIIKAKHIRTGGHNGNTANDFNEVFIGMSPREKLDFLQQMADDKKIVIREGSNRELYMLPK